MSVAKAEDNEIDVDDGGLPPVLASKYRIKGRLGEGGMGIVYSGDHLELRSRVAIKVLQPKLAQDANARARFLREARLAASIEGEHSTRIFDVGTDDEARPYMVMEFLAGESLDVRLARVRQIELGDAATIMLQLLDALAEAHAKGLVHRDIKPANLFLVEKPGEPIWVKVMDFGISKAMLAEQDDNGGKVGVTLTAPRTLLGSPEYMSPEQLRDSAAVDTRSDLWACGVVLFELLTGGMPFEGASLADLYAQIVGQEPRSLVAAGLDGTPAAVSRLIERCLRKDAAERPRNVSELAAVLAPYARDSARALLPRIRAWCKTDAEVAAPARSRRSLVAGVGLVVIAGVIAFVAASVRAPAPSPPPSFALRPPVTALVPPPSPAAVVLPDASITVSPVEGAAPPAVSLAKAASSAPKPGAARPAGKKPQPGRIQDIGSIELLP